MLLAEKFIVLAKYLDFADMFLKKSANVLSKQTRGNEQAIELEEGKQPPNESIYSLGPMEVETFKTYIKTNLANGFIRDSKSLAGA